ncbi:helix-turn-helix domain-containing protein [Massilia endophytica]|uniref:helix-turn-helix domain-containing protein n=1 Tax=Massilia endophytica TaxID=2899220 RepID=UPI001E60CCF4|nr:helix-turn-helix domain-containing protein [Massilia endophytica]UGQ45947.1 helix-turn-helix domain-containing protein [Massilia endophytica]
MMLYREYPPSPALAPHVACLWTAHVRPAPGALPFRHRVLPDNCVDILWQDTGAPAFAVGMMSSAVIVPSAGPVRTVAVRFRPGSAGRFLGIPLDGLSDQRAALPELWGASAADRLHDALWERELSDLQRLALIENALLSFPQHWERRASAARRRAARSQEGGLALAAVRAIEAAGGALAVEPLAARLGVSRQHLSRQFGQQVGLTPKLFARITRFRRAADAVRGRRHPDWAAVAAECGYFDQSHLIRDFHDFAALTPEQFLLPLGD